MTITASVAATLLTVLPPVTPPVAGDCFSGSYERDENGIIQALMPETGAWMTDEERARSIGVTGIANQQYTILHDNFGSKAAESTNYGWVGGDGYTTSKIRSMNGYSTIHSEYDKDYVVSRHYTTLIGDDRQTEPETDYIPGNAGLAALAA